MEQKNKKYIIIILCVIFSTLVIGLFITFFSHKKLFSISRMEFLPVTIIDVEEDVDMEDVFDYALFTCIKYDLVSSDLPSDSLEKLLFLRRITITDRITDENGDNYYKLDYRTFFNIKYREDVITKKIDPRLINRGCR